MSGIIKVYIASPYSKGDVAQNVRRQIDVANELMDKGFCPFAPTLTHFQHFVHPRPYEDWMTVDFEWLEVCNCVLRLAGESAGADREVELAGRIGIPVYHSVKEIEEAYIYANKKQ